MNKPGLPQSADKRIRALSYLLGLIHLIFGGTILMSLTGWTAECTESWVLPLWFMYFVGFMQILGGLGLFTRSFKMTSAYLMTLLMTGAMATAIISGQYANLFVYLIILILCLIVFYHCLSLLATEIDKPGYQNK